MKLLIVESPTKGKTISKFLGKDYTVASSYGHVRDLPQKTLGVDVKNNFEPEYVIPLKAKKHVAELKKLAKTAKETILATDSDREGESIAYHLGQVLKLKEPKRIVFHEITKSAIENALKNPRALDMRLVNAQQARRILDRLVGYKLSPFLWKKVMRGLSAGRVQSVAVKLICQREEEIKAFKPEEYWSVIASLLKTQSNQRKFEAHLNKKDEKAIGKLGIKNKAEVDKILQDLEGAEYQIAKIEKKEAQRNPLPPFTTSTLQQTAGATLGFTAKRAMMLAQRLYERGYITYHRTDSLNLSAMSQQMARNFIEEKFGKNYWPGTSRTFKTKSKGAQEAHEAIRPSYPEKTPEALKKELDRSQWRLYELIWKRFMASQMASAIFDSQTIDIKAKNYTFHATGQTIKFDGFLKLYPLKFSENILPELTLNEIVRLEKLLTEQHFTQPPSRYSEATLIKKLEEEGIGRPSTYAPTIDTIQQRKYIEKDENKKLKPSQIGQIVNKLLVEHFPQVVDLQFTAKMEKELDEITEGKDTWIKTLSDFYTPFIENLKEKENSVEKVDMTEKTDKICPKCQSPVIIRWGRFGRFYACSTYPKCDYGENLPKPSLNLACPKCQVGQVVEKKTKRNKIFYGCSKWPDCDFALWQKPARDENNQGQVAKCPDCGSPLMERGKKIVCSNKECLKKPSTE